MNLMENPILITALLVNILVLCFSLSLLPDSIKTYRKNKEKIRKLSFLEAFLPLLLILIVNYTIMNLVSTHWAFYVYPYIPSLILNTELLIAMYSVIANRRGKETQEESL